MSPTERRRERATLVHARRQLREHYLSDADGNAANAWYSHVHHAGWHSGLVKPEQDDDATADIVESVLWSSRMVKVRQPRTARGRR